MAPSKNNSDELTRKRKALIDAKYHEAKSRRKLKEKERELDAQYTTLKAQRAIYERLQAEVQSAKEEREQCANIVSILQIAQPSIESPVVSPLKPLGTSGPQDVSAAEIESAIDDDSLMEEYLQINGTRGASAKCCQRH